MESKEKNATLSDVTAKAEYRVDKAFIIKGIKAGKLEYRDGAIWGNPYLRILGSQLEDFIIGELGKKYLVRVKAESELRKIKKEIANIKKNLNVFQLRQIEIEKLLKE
jgi:hypothetical protein